VWKKDEVEPLQTTTPRGTATATPRAVSVGTTTGMTGTKYATIGPSIVVKGEVSGDEDLVIQGEVDGSVSLGLHMVTIGGGGRVKADVTGRVITVEGSVEGDLEAKEQIVLRGGSKVLGDLKAPRVVLEDGASFKGLVDMGTGKAKDQLELDADAEGKDKPATRSATATGHGPANGALKSETPGGLPKTGDTPKDGATTPASA